MRFCQILLGLLWVLFEVKKAYDDKVYYQDHAWTRDLINPEKVKGEIKQFFRPRSQDTQKAVSDNALVF